MLKEGAVAPSPPPPPFGYAPAWNPSYILRTVIMQRMFVTAILKPIFIEYVSWLCFFMPYKKRVLALQGGISKWGIAKETI